jgi:hypothetical protein
MVATWVKELSDGEELVLELEGVSVSDVPEDPRERTFEVRRLAVNRLTLDEPAKASNDLSAEMGRE